MATFGGPLLLGGRYFRVAKMCTVHGPFEVNKIETKYTHFLFGETDYMLLF